LVAIMACVAGVGGAVAWNVVGLPDKLVRGDKPGATVAESFTSATKLAESNDPTAEYKLAHMYASAAGVDGSRKQSLLWLERAAEHGNVDAQYEFGNALREGYGVVQDYERAAKWLQLAAEQGNADAQYTLGQMYRMGTGLAVDNAKAYMWFNLAAAQEFAGAASQRDAVLRHLSQEQILEAQAEARRLNDAANRQLTKAQ